MVVTTTTASALAAGSALSGFSGAQRYEALFLLSAVAGLMMIAAGLLRLGRYVRFVSVSVLTGFLTGVAINIILGQLGDLLGSPQKGRPAVLKAFNVLTHPSEMSLTAAAVGQGALALMALLSRTRLTSIAPVVALAIPTLLSLGAGNLVRVEDSGPISSGIPTPHLPQLSLLSSLQLIAGAAAVTSAAFRGRVQPRWLWTLASMTVPRPGCERISARPPTAPKRSWMFWSPTPS